MGQEPWTSMTIFVWMANIWTGWWQHLQKICHGKTSVYVFLLQRQTGGSNSFLKLRWNFPSWNFLSLKDRLFHCNDPLELWLHPQCKCKPPSKQYLQQPWHPPGGVSSNIDSSNPLGVASMPRSRSKQASSSEEEWKLQDDDDDISCSRKLPAKRRKRLTRQSFETEDFTHDSSSHARQVSLCHKSPPPTVPANAILSPIKRRGPGHPRNMLNLLKQ